MFRDYRRGDLRACVSIVNRTMDRVHARVCREDLLAKVYPGTTRKRYTLVERKVLTVKNKVVALVCLYRLGTYPDNILGIDWLAVDPEYQSKGIGSRLVKWSERRARIYKKNVLFVWSVKAAIPFYKRHGFRKSSIIPIDMEEDREAVFLAKRVRL